MQKSAVSKSKEALAFFEAHKDVNEWYANFGTDAQMILCDPQIALGAISSLDNNDCPCLSLFKTCYQEDAMKWMQQQIDVLNVSVSTQNKLSAKQINILSADIFIKYYYWNLGDVCVFLGKVRRGQYGHFYGTIDNLMIMEWAKTYDKERQSEMEKFEQLTKENKAMEEKKKAHTLSRDAYIETLSDEEKESSALYALKTGKKKLFENTPYMGPTIPTGMPHKPIDLDCPPPLSAETQARRDAMIAEAERQLNNIK